MKNCGAKGHQDSGGRPGETRFRSSREGYREDETRKVVGLCGGWLGWGANFLSGGVGGRLVKEEAGQIPEGPDRGVTCQLVVGNPGGPLQVSF